MVLFNGQNLSWTNVNAGVPQGFVLSPLVCQTFSQKLLGVVLDFKLTFKDHLNNVLAKVNKAVGLYANFEIHYQGQR